MLGGCITSTSEQPDDDGIVPPFSHPRTLLTEFVRFHDDQRPHRTLTLETPVPGVRAVTGPIRASLLLGGLHRVYERAA